MVHAVNWVQNHQNVNIVMALAWKPYRLDHLLCVQRVDIVPVLANIINTHAWNVRVKDKM